MQRFVNLYVTGLYSNAKLAEVLDIHPNTISKWLKRNDVRDVIADMQADQFELTSNNMKALTQKAVDRLHDLLDSSIDGVALQAVNTILDRTGHKAVQRVEKNVTVKTYEEKLNRLIDATVVDADIVEEEEEEE